MLYYRVKAENDGDRRIVLLHNGKQAIDGEYIKGELYTERELKKYINGFQACQLVEIPKSRIYFSFGVRFAKEANG